MNKKTLEEIQGTPLSNSFGFLAAFLSVISFAPQRAFILSTLGVYLLVILLGLLPVSVTITLGLLLLIQFAGFTVLKVTLDEKQVNVPPLSALYLTPFFLGLAAYFIVIVFASLSADISTLGWLFSVAFAFVLGVGMFCLAGWVSPSTAKENQDERNNLIWHVYQKELQKLTPNAINEPITAEKLPDLPKPPQPHQPELPRPGGNVPQGSVYLGDFHDQQDYGLWIYPPLRARHLYCIGKTRTGKTTLIKSLALQDVASDHGVCFVDPHGDAALDLIGSIKRRAKDVIYFDPTSSYCPAFNIFRLPFPPSKLAEDIMSVMQALFDIGSAPRMEHLMRYSVLTLLLDKEPRTLRDLRRILIDADFRAEIVRTIEDDDLRAFWEQEFPSMGKDAVNPIINKFSSFLLPGSPMLKMFSQKENDLDFSAILNEQKILIVNLSKGLLGDIPSRILGGLIVTGIQQAALARQELLADQRKDFYLYLDEFQNFTVNSFEAILSESAKYKLYLTLAHQTLGQVPASLQAAIFGNVATLVAFGISADDATKLRKEMHHSRFFFRKPNADAYVTLDDIIAERKQRELNGLAFNQNKLEVIERACQAARRTYEIHGTPSHYATLDEWIADIRKEEPKILDIMRNCEEELKNLESFSVATPERLREVFSDYDIRQSTFPDVDDFLNIPPRHAFVRVERADNVNMIRTIAPLIPESENRNAILQQMQRTYEARQQQRINEESLQSGVEPTPRKTSAHVEPEPPRPTNGLDTQVPLPAVEEVQASAEQLTKPRRNGPKTPPKTDEDFEF